MEARIRFAKGRNGARIAFWTLGSGYPIINAPLAYASHIEKEWAAPDLREWYERLAQDFTVIRFDSRGLGLSKSERSDFSMEAMAEDYDAIVAALGLRDFAIFAVGNAAPAAIKYSTLNAAATHLILWHAVDRAADWYQNPEGSALHTLAQTNWEMFSLASVGAVRDWKLMESPRPSAAVIEATGQSHYFKILDALREHNVTNTLPSVTAKTLILHRRDYHGVDPSHSRFLAAQIPDARLELLEGTSGSYLRDEEVCNSIRSFLFADAAAALAARMQRGNHAVLEGITPREAEVLRLIVTGLSNAEVAMRLGISVHTIERHLANLYEKRGVHSRVELILQLLNNLMPENQPKAGQLRSKELPGEARM